MSVKTKKFPAFSIITITLNNFAGLKKTFDSIQNQTFTDFEWIVVDGGSNDETVDFLRNHRSVTRSGEYPFNFTSEADSGIYDAMNKGMESARGHYLLFLNAGDILANEKVLSVINEHTQKKPDFIYGDALEPGPSSAAPVYKSARRYKNIAWGMITHHQAMLYRRHTIRDHQMHYSLLYKISSDYDFTIRFLKNSKKVIYINKPLCLFEQGGLSQQQAALGRKEQYLIREKLNLVPQPQNLWILIVQSLSWRLKNFSPVLYRIIKKIVLSFIDKN